MATNLELKSSENFYCEYCDYSTSRKSQYDRHLITRKHKLATNGNILELKSSEEKNEKKDNIFFNCECGKKYKDRTGLWRHKKKCSFKSNTPKSNNETMELKYKEMFLEVMKKNDEITDVMMEQQKTIQQMIPSINNTVNNTSNQVFNINMFLNEQCKDAMNISDFIESIHLTFEDMTNIGSQGQTQGMANILIDKLNTIDILKRPVHCSDIKKETIYIKDKDIWEQESKDKKILKNALDKLTVKSIEHMPCMENDPDEYVKTITEILKDPREDKKIISKLAKEILLNK